MSIFTKWYKAHYERKLIKAMIEAKIAELTQEKILIAREPSDCWGDDCNTCRCDLAPDCQ